MKKVRWLTASAVLAAMFLLTGRADCGMKAGAAVGTGSYGLSDTKKTMVTGRQGTIRLVHVGSGQKVLKASEIRWRTSDGAVVGVREKAAGKAALTAKRTGKATVTAAYHGRKYRCRVTVQDPPSLNAGAVSLYYRPKDYADILKANGSHKDSFQFRVTGTAKEAVRWELLGEDAEFFTLTPYGKVTATEGKIYGEPDASATVRATLENGEVLTATVTGHNEANLCLDARFREFAGRYITPGMTEKEKADLAARYIGETSDYEAGDPDWRDIFLRGRGDCMASRHALAVLCRYIGVKAQGCRSLDEHGKTVVRADGRYYIYTTGFKEPRPRGYLASETDWEYLEDNADRLGLWTGYFQDRDPSP